MCSWCHVDACMGGVVVYVMSRTSPVNTFTVNKIALVDNRGEKALHQKQVDGLAINE